MDTSRIQNRFRGCLIGGAAGDALGFPVEFKNFVGIQETYGNEGITKFILFSGFDRALISDDTQMTLFTTNGLLCYEAAKEAVITKFFKQGKSNEKTLYCLSGCCRRIHDGRL